MATIYFKDLKSYEKLVVTDGNIYSTPGVMIAFKENTILLSPDEAKRLAEVLDVMANYVDDLRRAVEL